MKKHTCALLFVLAAVGVLMSATLFAEETAAGAQFVGAKKCMFCHKDEATQWQTTKHFKAIETLKPEERNEKCMGCHTTGYGKTAAAGAELEGVQCEACHGAGSLYKDPVKIMNKQKYAADPAAQKKLAMEAGLVMPTKEVCVGCHNEKSPTFNKEKAFNFDEAIKKVAHKATAPCPPAK